MSPPEGDASGLQLIPQSPEQVAGSFLDAWSRSDYDAMYLLLSPESQQLYTPAVFRSTYEADDAVIGVQAVTHTITDVQRQGMTTVLTYDVTIESSIYDQIVDRGRIMRLTESGRGWGVAWSRMDIFAGLASGVILETVTDREPRGSILDRSGQPLVEEGGTVVTVIAQRNTMPDEFACFSTLASAMRRDYDDLIEFFNSYGPAVNVAVGDMDPDVYAIREQELIDNCAIQSYNRQTRRYVGHGTLSHVTGSIGQISPEELEQWKSRGYDADDLIGLNGIERQYEEVLAGQPARILRIREPGGAIVREVARLGGREPQNLTLTIDADLQRIVGQALADAFNYAAPNWAADGRSTGGSVVVLDVNTGGVLAMSSWPTFDPGIFNPDTQIILVGSYIAALDADPRRPFFNRALQEQYPPGSTFKIITTAAALAEGVVQPDETFYCDLSWDGSEFGDTVGVRLDWRSFEPEERRIPTGEVTPELALAASCNPFFYRMGALLFRQRGPTTLMDYARRMGLGTPTGLDLQQPREASGQLPPIRAVDQAISSAIGQSDVQVTVLQMARMVAGIANGGTLYRPYIVQQIGDQAPIQPVAGGEMGIRESVLTIVQQGMCDVTTDTTYGTAWRVFGDFDNNVPSTPYIPCGKTGTAQSGRTEPHGWFVAYAPHDDPQIAIAVMIEYSREGSETAAPIARRILDGYFNSPPELVASYPDWWTESYVPLPIPEGSTGG